MELTATASVLRLDKDKRVESATIKIAYKRVACSASRDEIMVKRGKRNAELVEHDTTLSEVYYNILQL